MIRKLGVDRSVRLLAVLATALLIALGGLLVAIVDYQSNSANSKQIRGSCYFSRVVATAPIPPGVSELGLRFIAGARIWYTITGCPGERLPAPDPRVGQYLPPHVP